MPRSTIFDRSRVCQTLISEQATEQTNNTTSRETARPRAATCVAGAMSQNSKGSPGSTDVSRLQGLTGLRAIAAFWVISYHYSLSVFVPLGAAHASPFVDFGYLGVDLFFMLSGFVIWHVHAPDFSQPSPRRFGRFMALRAARLYPVHLFTLALMGLLLWAAPLWGSPPLDPDNYTIHTLLLQLTLVQSWGISDHGGWNYPAWSVSTEWFCYLLFPFAAVLVARLTSRGIRIGLLLLYLALGISFVTCFGKTMNHSVGLLSLLRATLEFFIGCLLRQYSLLASHRYWTPVVLAAAALWASLFWTSLPIGLLAIPLFAALILAAGTPTIIARLLTWLPMLAIGEASYTLYMMQAPVQKGARVLEHYFRPDQPVQNAVVAVAYLGTLALGTFLVHRFVENPSRRRLRYLIEAHLPRPRAGTRATRRPLRPQLSAVFSR